MGAGSKFLAFLFSYTAIWGSYEMYYKMRLEDFMSLGAIGYAILSLGCVFLGTLIAKAAVDS